MASTAAANFQAFAASTLGEWQSQQPAQATKTWWEPLGSQSAGQAAKPGGTHASAALTTLYRSPDIHARIVAMSKWFFQHDTYNELLQMVGECYGNGRLVEPTFTLLEGQAIANNPIFAGKAQQLGITAFYDYVFTVDWMAHRLDMVENILKTLSSMGRGGGNLGDVRFFQEQLDTMLMSPHRVTWYMWDKPEVRALLVDDIDPAAAKVKPVDRQKLQLLTLRGTQVTALEKYANEFLKDNATAFISENETDARAAVVGTVTFRNTTLATQEAVLLNSPLWNELCAIGQGLFRVYLTRAQSSIGFGSTPVAQGSFINAFELGSIPINVIPSRADTAVVYRWGYANFDERKQTDDNKFSALIAQESGDYDTKNAASITAGLFSGLKTKSHTINLINWKWPGVEYPDYDETPNQLDFRSVQRGLLQPKILDLLLYACIIKEWEAYHMHGKHILPDKTKSAYEKLKRDAEAASNVKMLNDAIMSAHKHNGAGGAIGTFICNGTGLHGRFMVEGHPRSMIVTSDMVSVAMKAQTHHPIHHCADLATAMRRGLAFSAADMAASKLDAFYQPKSAPQNLFEHLRVRLRDLENRYALVRTASANDDQHPVATADSMFADSFLGYGPHAKLPQCPAGSLPMIFDSIHSKSLSAEQWQKQVVRINGEPMLPAHLQIQGCLPARRADSDPNPTSSTTNVFQGLLGQLKL